MLNTPAPKTLAIEIPAVKADDVGFGPGLPVGAFVGEEVVEVTVGAAVVVARTGPVEEATVGATEEAASKGAGVAVVGIKGAGVAVVGITGAEVPLAMKIGRAHV